MNLISLKMVKNHGEGGSEVVVAQVFRGVHVLIVLEHPLRALQVGDVLLHLRHYLVDILSFSHNWVVLLLVEVILLIEVFLLGPNLDRS